MHLSEITKVHLRGIAKAKSVSYGLSWIAKADIVISCSEPAGLKPCQLPQRQTQVAQPPPKKKCQGTVGNENGQENSGNTP